MDWGKTPEWQKSLAHAPSIVTAEYRLANANGRATSHVGICKCGKQSRMRMRKCDCTGVGVVGDGGCEADARGPAAGGGDGQRRQVHDRAQQLALGHSRVAHQQTVNVPTQMRPIRQVSLPAASFLSFTGSISVIFTNLSLLTSISHAFPDEWQNASADKLHHSVEISKFMGNSLGVTADSNLRFAVP